MYCTVYSTQGCTEATVKLYRPWLQVEHWRVPDAELSRILRRHLFLNFVLECVAIP